MKTGTEQVDGKCFCGTVQFAIALPVKFCGNCHCSMCRRAHGAAFVTWVGVPAEALEISSGAENLSRYHPTPASTRSFCATCGSQMFCEGERSPGEVHVARALLDDAAPLVPQGHGYFSHKAPWLTVSDALPKFGGDSGLEPLQ